MERARHRAWKVQQKPPELVMRLKIVIVVCGMQKDEVVPRLHCSFCCQSVFVVCAEGLSAPYRGSAIVVFLRV